MKKTRLMKMVSFLYTYCIVETRRVDSRRKEREREGERKREREGEREEWEISNLREDFRGTRTRRRRLDL